MRDILVAAIEIGTFLILPTQILAAVPAAFPSWDFSNGDHCGWHPNQEWHAGTRAGSFWRLEADDSPAQRIPAGQAALVSPELVKPVTIAPGDSVEAVLRSSRTGWITLFYAIEVKGKKQNFGAAHSERRLLYASKEFQTFRVRPRWQAGMRVYKLLLHGPSFGGTLDIRSIRLARGTDGSEDRTVGSWDFRQPDVARDVLGDHPPANLSTSEAGLEVCGNDGPGMISLDSQQVDADANPWVRVRMRVGAGPLGGIAFHPANRGTDQKMQRYWSSQEFIKWFQFSIRADGAFHTYNIRLSDYDYAAGGKPDPRNHRRTGFEGTQRVFHVVPSHNPHANSCVESLSFDPKPAGPMLLVCEYAGAAEAVLRQGRPGVIAVRLRNSGGAPASNFKVERIDKNENVTIGTETVRGVPETLPPDTTLCLYLDISSTRAGRQHVTLRIRCQGDQLTVPIVLDVEPHLELQQGIIPEPHPIRTNYHIGCYYFTGWSHLQHWPKIPPLAERRPALGYYDELSPEAADWDIKWAVEHGVDHFVVLWYHHDGKQRTRFIEDALLKAKFLPHIKFCVMWCNANNPWWKFSEQDFMDITNYWIRNYFPHPQYRRDKQGRPIAWMLQGWNMVHHFGKDAAIRLMRDADTRARAAGFPGIHWIACQHGGKRIFDDPAQLREVGFQEWTAYNINGLKSYPYPVVPAQTVVDAAPVIWNHIPVKPVLPVFCGWNSRWSGRDFTCCYGFTPELFRQHLAQARAFLDKTDADSIVIDCWNEWGEGEVLGPHAQYGFRLLKQIPKVFAPDESPRPVVVPEDVGLRVPQIQGLWQRVNRPPLKATP